MDELTVDQLAFVCLASAEDARIRMGGGSVKRTGMDTNTPDATAKLRSTADLAKSRRAVRPGGELYERSQEIKKIQAPLRKQIENMVLQVAEQEQRHR